MRSKIITSLLIYTFIFLNTRWCSCNHNSPNNSTLKCIPSERAGPAQLQAHSLTYFDKDVSSTWEGEECCKWGQVSCDKTTGHILQLDLIGYSLQMKTLNSLVYLLELKRLEWLDLSHNNFSYSSIPKFMGSFKQLRYLDLSSASLGGLVPYELCNLTNLRFLDLYGNMLSGEIPAYLGNLLNLKELYLSRNNLSSIASSLRFPSTLESLFLSFNQLSSKIPTSIGKLSKLQNLYINSNPFKGTVLSEFHFANLSSLIELSIDDTMLKLNLSFNWVPPFQLNFFSANRCKINGQIPPWLRTQNNLTNLELSNTNISGFMPRWLHTMQQLDSMDLSNNTLSGSPIFPINIFFIDLSNNSLSGLLLSNCSKTEKYHSAQEIYLQNNFITGPLPECLGSIMPWMENLLLANNRIVGSIPNSLCQSRTLTTLDMQNNMLTGVIPNCWGLSQTMLASLYLSNNNLSGPVPNSLCHLTSLSILDIQNNSLSGVIPNCWASVSSLYFVRLSYNKLKGHIPCFNNRDPYPNELINDFYLHLNNNMLSGEIPSCLSGFTNLKVLDIGGNEFSGKMVKWFRAEKLRELQIHRLRGNNFSGTIPRQICFLPHLQLMDLGHNQFTGSIPHCLSNLTAMTSPIRPNNVSEDNFLGDIKEVIQGIERAYTSTLPYLVDIDLSGNKLSGSIPDDMTNISCLMSLNLSYNQLSGTIPKNIGGLKSLISLDLSRNKLKGSIPTSIGQIYTLSHLNLSYNNLSGQIPTGNQLQTLSDQASIYAGNPYLCGDFLPKKCKSKVDKQDKGTSNEGTGDNKKKLKKMGFDLVVVSGFATGFWGVVGCLVLNRRWRHAFFGCLEGCYNWLYVIVVLKVRVIKAKIKRGE